MNGKRVLVVEADATIRAAVCELIRAAGFDAVPIADMASDFTILVPDEAEGEGTRALSIGATTRTCLLVGAPGAAHSCLQPAHSRPGDPP